MRLIIILLLCPIAGAIAVSPDELSFNVIRETPSSREFYILNAGGSPLQFEIQSSSSHIEAHPASAILAPGSKGRITATVNMPNASANGNYSAYLIIKEKPTHNAAASSLYISSGAAVRILISLTGTQVLSGTVDTIALDDCEINEPARLRFSFRNTGNVYAAPSAILQTGNASACSEFRPTAPGETSEYILQLNLSLDLGRHEAFYKIFLDNGLLKEGTIHFRIHPQFDLSRNGELLSLNVTSLEINRYSRVSAVFHNTGKAGTSAQFRGEVTRGGSIVDILKSDPIRVEVDRAEALASYFRPDDYGAYQLSGWVVYDGRKTGAKTLFFNIENKKAGLSQLTGRVIGPAAKAGGLIIPVAVIILLYLWARGQGAK
ncbi:MAG: hypothetical protein ABH879_02315 [archaeon]